MLILKFYCAHEVKTHYERNLAGATDWTEAVDLCIMAIVGILILLKGIHSHDNSRDEKALFSRDPDPSYNPQLWCFCEGIFKRETRNRG